MSPGLRATLFLALVYGVEMLLEEKEASRTHPVSGGRHVATITSSFLLAYVRTDFSHLQIRPLIPQVRVRVRPGVEVAGQNASHLLLCDIFLLHLSSPKWVPSRHVWYAKSSVLPASGQKDGDPGLQKHPDHCLPPSVSSTITM